MSNSGKLGFGRSAEDFLRLLNLGDCGDECLDSKNGMSIISIKHTDGGKIKICVLIKNPSGSEELEFNLLSELADELSLELGEIDDEIISGIERSAEITRAYFSAISSLAFSEGSLSSLVRKLVQKGFARDISEDAVAIIYDRGLVDERKTVESRIRVFLGKRWGRGRIIAKLREEGFSDGSIKSAADFLSEIDFVSLCAEQIRRKYPTMYDDRAARERIYASLARYGYSSAEIREAIKITIEEE